MVVVIISKNKSCWRRRKCQLVTTARRIAAVEPVLGTVVEKQKYLRHLEHMKADSVIAKSTAEEQGLDDTIDI